MHKIDHFPIDPELFEVVEVLSDKEAGRLIRCILQYANGLGITTRDPLIEAAFIPFKKSIDDAIKKSKKGGNHWNWKGGITKENKLIRNGSKIKMWRKDVFQRDDYTCQKCQTKGGILHAHHILGFATHPSLRFDLNNGLTLCKRCHNKIHSK